MIAKLSERLTAIELARALARVPVLSSSAVESVTVQRAYAAPTAEIAHLSARLTGRTDEVKLVAKLSADTRSGLCSEVTFHERVAPLWAAPSPEYFGSSTLADGAHFLLTEDLSTDYETVGTSPSQTELERVVDVLVEMHSAFWEKLTSPISVNEKRSDSPSSMAAAFPASIVDQQIERLPVLARAFLEGSSREVGAHDLRILEHALEMWPLRFRQRVKAGNALTAIHGDFHLIGNVMHTRASPSLLKVIDWADFKPGLGPHDLAYCLLPVTSRSRPSRDRALLMRYHKGLMARGVRNYSWELCKWDYHISIIANLFQCLLQGSSRWVAITCEVIRQAGALAVLAKAPPWP